jgi:hypothetical protein
MRRTVPSSAGGPATAGPPALATEEWIGTAENLVIAGPPFLTAMNRAGRVAGAVPPAIASPAVHADSRSTARTVRSDCPPWCRTGRRSGPPMPCACRLQLLLVGAPSRPRRLGSPDYAEPWAAGPPGRRSWRRGTRPARRRGCSHPRWSVSVSWRRGGQREPVSQGLDSVVLRRDLAAAGLPVFCLAAVAGLGAEAA